jgi:hypothetical protein
LLTRHLKPADAFPFDLTMLWHCGKKKAAPEGTALIVT